MATLAGSWSSSSSTTRMARSAGSRRALNWQCDLPPGSLFGELRHRSSVPFAAAEHPGLVPFPSEWAGDRSDPAEVTINQGPTSIQFGTPALGGANPDQFAIDEDDCSSATLQAGQECRVTVRFAPTTAGAKSAWLQIPDNTFGGSRRILLTGASAAPLPTPTSTPTLAPGVTRTATTDPGEIHIVAISASICLAFGGAVPADRFSLWRPGNQHRLADIISHGAPEAPPRGGPTVCNSGGLPPGCVPIGEAVLPATECPVNGYDPSNFRRRQANNPNTDVCRLLPSDFAPLANLTDPPQLHAEDPGTSAASGPFTGLYVLAFLPTDDPVEFRTSAGGFVQVEDSPGPFALHDSTYMCNGQFEDCDGDGQSFKYMIAVPLGGYGAALGSGAHHRQPGPEERIARLHRCR